MGQPVVNNTDPAFDSAGLNLGLEIWRIEDFKPVPVPAEDHGKFYTGDAYIVLRSYLGNGGQKRWDLHFWQGAECSQDERGTVAVKAVELDTKLGGAPVQFREIQGHESADFHAIFRDMGGLVTLSGGVASGFNHVVKDDYKTTLFHLKGYSNVRVKQVECSVSSLRKGDVFVLDNGLQIYQWNGPGANKREKFKGLKLVQRLKDSRGARPTVTLVEGDSTDAAAAAFWDLLGGKSDIPDIVEQDDDEADNATESEVRLFMCSKFDDETDAAGNTIPQLVPVPREEGKLSRTMLQKDTNFLLDTGVSMYLWHGSRAPKSSKAAAFQAAENLLANERRPVYTAITSVPEGTNFPIFESYFADWEPAVVTGVPGGSFMGHVSKGIANTEQMIQEEIKVDELLKDLNEDQMKEVLVEKMSAWTRACAGESAPEEGSVEIWRIENFERVPLKEAEYGHFYSGDSYIVLHTYTPPNKNREEKIIYYWQGAKSSIDEKGASALLAAEMDRAMGGSPVQVRVTQGSEPGQFCALFNGKMVVHTGGISSGFRSVRSITSEADPSDDDVDMFHCKGTTKQNCRAVQIEPPRASSLNSGDTFVVRSGNKCYVWCGSGAQESEVESAQHLAEYVLESYNMLGQQGEIVKEGDEPKRFWKALGGKTEYAKASNAKAWAREPRLFHCCDISGVFRVEEVVRFAQSDLNPSDVMILDAFTSVYVWIGQEATDREKTMAVDTAKKFLNYGNRDRGTAVIRVEQGNEPSMFKAQFLAWSDEKTARFVDPYEEKLRQMALSKQSKTATSSFGQALLRSTTKESNRSGASGRPAFSPKNGGYPSEAASVKSSSKFGASLKHVDPPAVDNVPPKQASKPKVQAQSGECYSLASLQAREIVGLDPTKLESYLSDAEFEEAFKMDKQAFYALAKWKQQKLKKDHKIF